MASRSSTAKKSPSKRGGAQGTTAATKKRPEKKPRKRHWLRFVVTVLLLAAVVFAAAFSWDRWFRFDDGADIQGEWKVAGQPSTTIISAHEIALTNAVSYAYSLDTGDKTISLTFGQLKGSGTYRFSEDRQTVTITEGATTNLFADVLRCFGITLADTSSDPALTTVLAKVSNATDGTPQDLTNNTTDEANAAGKVLDAAVPPDAAGAHDDATEGVGEGSETQNTSSSGDASATNGSPSPENSESNMLPPSDISGPQ